ncbi:MULTISPECIES: hypothetical protein [Sphingobium]|uniref:hypothetical protein n=1 Tax=Sphingobium TaxID=165695 RepID=UPI00159C73E0|nr:hypothetical protein [Sphingobium sp. 15-1]
MPTDISPLFTSAYRELVSLERFVFRRDQLLEGLDWSAMTLEFTRQAALNDEELACNIFEITTYVRHLEWRTGCCS